MFPDGLALGVLVYPLYSLEREMGGRFAGQKALEGDVFCTVQAKCPTTLIVKWSTIKRGQMIRAPSTESKKKPTSRYT